MTSRVLITGAFGYLGSRIARFLAEGGDYELLLGTRRKGLERPEWLERGEVVPFDVMSDHLESLCRGVDQIVHLAAVNEIDSAASPTLALRVNGEGSLRLLGAATQSGVKRFLFFSTAHVYGALEGTITEATLPKPTHPYAISHRVAEDFVLAEQAKGSLDGIVVRLSNGFGPPDRADVNRWTLLVNDLCRQAVTAQKLTLRSSGMQRRDFITLHDVTRATQHLLELPRPSLLDGLFNLGGESAVSVYDMTTLIADRCQALFGFRPAIERPAPRAGEVAPALDYRIDKLKRTGFELKGNMVEEIDGTLRFCHSAFAGADIT